MKFKMTYANLNYSWKLVDDMGEIAPIAVANVYFIDKASCKKYIEVLKRTISKAVIEDNTPEKPPVKANPGPYYPDMIDTHG